MADHVDLGDLDDPIGEASIRLLAAGVPGAERLAAVMFLGVLHDHAQPDGRLRVDPFDLAEEFGVGRAEAIRFLGRLTDAAAVGRFGDAWWVSRHEPLHASAVPHALGLSMLRDPEASPMPVAPTRRVRSSWPAAVAAVAMVVMGIAGVLRTSAPVAPTAVGTVAARSSAGTATPVVPTPASVENTVSATSPPHQGPAAPVTAPQGASAIATATCPALPAPVAIIAAAESPGVVHGTLRNDHARAVMVHAVEVIVGEEGLVIPALATPVRVEPGSVLAFEVGLPPGTPVEGLTAVVRDFSYDAC